MKVVMSSLMDKQDRLLTENTALKLRVAECEKFQQVPSYVDCAQTFHQGSIPHMIKRPDDV
ncbi:hypothetical protein E2C01_015393 [Portunus trituberculatus]|uniref:Uncharacterized protein n=1 Tax=Portunus trituberculatus TaxID=210409 RepID=A0A5B7DMR6_PORTR|nr:hypothetical protein [Portunus trituberculatus]